MEPRGVTHLPEPLSPTNRSRVHKVEPTNRSHNVHHEPKPHSGSPTVCHQFVIRAPESADPEREKNPQECKYPKGFRFVAGAGFEPATFGL